MEQWVSEIVEAYGYFGVFFLIAVENIFPPIPSEVILTFGGFMTTQTQLTVFGVVLAATAGSIAGAILLYGIGRVLSAERLEAIVVRYGRVLRLKPEDVRKADAWFDKYGAWAVFFGRLVPLIRSLISIPAGMSGMRFAPFLLLTAIGSLIWNAVLIGIGAAVGASWDKIVHYVDIYSNFAYAAIALTVVLAGYWFVKDRFLKGRK